MGVWEQKNYVLPYSFSLLRILLLRVASVTAVTAVMVVMVVTAVTAVTSTIAEAHGYNADRVKILYVPAENIYRITIRYTNVEVGEYREAHVDYRNRKEALKVYWDLVNGADFFLGDVKDSLHFHDPVQKNNPY